MVESKEEGTIYLSNVGFTSCATMASNESSQANPGVPSVPLQRPTPLPYYPTQPVNAAAGPSSTLASQYAPNWKNGWTMATYPFSSQNVTPYPQQQYLYTQPKLPQAGSSSNKAPTLNFAQAPKAPSPSPPPEPSKNWDHALKTFLESVGLTKALRGFELDMLVLNSDWEKQKVPGALQELATSIQVCTLKLLPLWILISSIRKFNEDNTMNVL